MGEASHPTAADFAQSTASDARDRIARLERAVARMPHGAGGSHADIEHRFSYHPATTDERRAQHEAVRDACKRLAHALDRLVPVGRQKSLALTAVEEAMHWANAAVACEVPAPSAPSAPSAPPITLTGEDTLPPEPDEVITEADVVVGDTWHVVPTPPDAIEHVTDDSAACPCEPRLEPQPGGGLVIVHNAADGRP
ncbi:hypothetical protein PBI_MALAGASYROSE_5 [Mycobacterium phage MalagasyRose]|uniref:Acb2/Tad1 hairpin domain-containing protein n=1 Tax=Mycobacterium phage MalagasyRose TaxID=2599870 RepID=A0A5J6TE31_9CAUD|nr:hypothetical protein QEH39_gp83 [Mycobacterium phage MalagasyRose]QFG08855.1 hypothetical protein PBI_MALAGASYROSE_5 [Mycobacterium phage MalagasyRose]